jgi:hypothetical protein
MASTPYDDDYQSVAERIAIFRTKHPDGSLCALDPAKPFEIVHVGDKVFIAVTAAAYRSPEDPAPGVGLAWQVFPGTDEYTRDNELMIAQTSAWGRAIVAALAADAKKIATKDEVRAAQSNRAPANPAPSAASANGTAVKQEEPPQSTDPTAELYNSAVVDEAMRLMKAPTTTYDELRDVWQMLSQARLGARRIDPPPGMDADGDGKVPILSAVAFVGKQRKENAPAAQTELAVNEKGAK